MASKLGPIEIDCDAPPYRIVQACRQIGIRSPEDVRWLRMAKFRSGLTDRPQGLYSRVWSIFVGHRPRSEKSCSCGAPLPVLELVSVTSDIADEITYHLGQCDHCHTVFWDEP